jgi:hypothetical protein
MREGGASLMDTLSYVAIGILVVAIKSSERIAFVLVDSSCWYQLSVEQWTRLCPHSEQPPSGTQHTILPSKPEATSGKPYHPSSLSQHSLG